MKRAYLLFPVFFMVFGGVLVGACGSVSNDKQPRNAVGAQDTAIRTGAEQLDQYLPLLADKKVGLMGNQTSVVGERHLVDVLLEEGVSLQFAFAPEHGFRGDIERGEKVSNDVDEQTGLPLYSLYGKNEKADSIVAAVDVMLF